MTTVLLGRSAVRVMATSPPGLYSPKRSGRKFLLLSALIMLGISLLAFRLYLPTLVKNYLNRTLEKIPGYEGHIDDVTLHLWRGAYSIWGLDLLKTGGQVPVPLFSARKVYFSIHWKALLHRSLVGKVELDHPQLNFVTGPNEAEKQTAVDASWQDRVKEMFPLRVNRLGIKDGEIHFRNYHADPKIDIFLHDIYALATNLTNSQKISKTLKATLDAHGMAMTHGDFQTHAAIDPFTQKPTLTLDLKLTNLDLPDLNDFLKHYLAVEAKDGVLNLYSQTTAVNGTLEGYAKPLINNLDVVALKKEHKSIGEFFKGIGVKMAAVVFKNYPKQQLGTKINISGSVDQPKIAIWPAVKAFFHNAFIKALPSGFEAKSSLKEGKENEEPPK